MKIEAQDVGASYGWAVTSWRARCESSRAWKEALLMAVSGYGQEDRRRSLEAGFDQHLVKPVDPPTLKGLIASLVAR